ncbi:MAG: response regulator, partial [Alphaproteobacteria bacterium]
RRVIFSPMPRTMSAQHSEFTCRLFCKARRRRQKTSPAEGFGNQEVILVVEDEESVRDMVARVLEKKGYLVLQAGNGRDGLDQLSGKPQIDLLLTDVLLPGGLNGQQVADAALSIRSDLKVMFMSGYAKEAIIDQGRLKSGTKLLSKPFLPTVLAEQVRMVLDS